jgi:hypothetical protein
MEVSIKSIKSTQKVISDTFSRLDVNQLKNSSSGTIPPIVLYLLYEESKEILYELTASNTS